MSSLFSDAGDKPDDASLCERLGRTKTHWDAILDLVDAKYGDVAPEWKFYGKKHGWQLKLMGKKRAFAYMVPHDRSFLVGMALRPAEVEGLREAGIAEELAREIEEGKAFQEGRPAQIEVRSKGHVQVVKRLFALRAAHS